MFSNDVSLGQIQRLQKKKAAVEMRDLNALIASSVAGMLLPVKSSEVLTSVLLSRLLLSHVRSEGGSGLIRLI